MSSVDLFVGLIQVTSEAFRAFLSHSNLQPEVAERKYLTYETLNEGRVARITLAREKSRNAQNRGLPVELGDAFMEAESDDQVRVVILAGRDRSFLPAMTSGPRRRSSSVRLVRTCTRAT
jgi:1,4-dihydroxy-2-naphthoyl-CoA synthase